MLVYINIMHLTIVLLTHCRVIVTFKGRILDNAFDKQVVVQYENS